MRISKQIVLLTLVVSGSNLLAAPLPDLRINRALLARSVDMVYRTFAADDCAVIEGCVPGPGTRKILRFDASIANIGRSDLVIGDPAARTNLFVYSPCHDHYHMKGFSTYELLDSSGRLLRRSRKQGFCLRDDQPFLANAPAATGYDCNNQGISQGWQDIYDKSLDCQFLDVTGVPPGRYVLRVTVNPRRILRESNYGNNSVVVPLRLRRPTAIQPVTVPRHH